MQKTQLELVKAIASIICPDVAIEDLTEEQCKKLKSIKALKDLSKKVKKSKSDSSDTDDSTTRVKAPVNAYIRFCQAKRIEVKKDGMSPKDVTRELGRLWKIAKENDTKEYKQFTSEYESAKKDKEASSGSDSEAKVKAPVNAYIRFCQEKRAEVKKSHPEMTSKEITSELGSLWKIEKENNSEIFQRMNMEYKNSMEKYKSESEDEPEEKTVEPKNTHKKADAKKTDEKKAEPKKDDAKVKTTDVKTAEPKKDAKVKMTDVKTADVKKDDAKPSTKKSKTKDVAKDSDSDQEKPKQKSKKSVKEVPIEVNTDDEIEF
jgi:hypothetical protein